MSSVLSSLSSNLKIQFSPGQHECKMNRLAKRHLNLIHWGLPRVVKSAWVMSMEMRLEVDSTSCWTVYVGSKVGSTPKFWSCKVHTQNAWQWGPWAIAWNLINSIFQSQDPPFMIYSQCLQWSLVKYIDFVHHTSDAQRVQPRIGIALRPYTAE